MKSAILRRDRIFNHSMECYYEIILLPPRIYATMMSKQVKKLLFWTILAENVYL